MRDSKTERYVHYLINALKTNFILQVFKKKALMYDGSKYESLRQMRVNKERVAHNTVSFEKVVLDTEV